MKKLAAILLLVGSLGLAHAAPKKIAFERDSDVFIANIDGTGVKKIARGQSPDFSPDGSMLVYNTVQADGKPSFRQIAVLDLATGKTTMIVKDIPSTNVMEATFSPDGKQLLFCYYANDDRHLGIINIDGSGFRDVQKSEPKHMDYWSEVWAADGKSIFAQDMESLYQIDLDAKVLHKWPTTQLAPGGSMSGDVRLDPSPDGKLLLMDIEMNERARKGWDGPPPAIWTMDLATQKMTRLTPKALYAYDSHWLDAPNSILFVSIKAGEEDTNLYRMSTTGKGKVLLAKGAINPSTSR